MISSGFAVRTRGEGSAELAPGPAEGAFGIDGQALLQCRAIELMGKRMGVPTRGQIGEEPASVVEAVGLDDAGADQAVTEVVIPCAFGDDQVRKELRHRDRIDVPAQRGRPSGPPAQSIVVDLTERRMRDQGSKPHLSSWITKTLHGVRNLGEACHEPCPER